MRRCASFKRILCCSFIVVLIGIYLSFGPDHYTIDRGGWHTTQQTHAVSVLQEQQKQRRFILQQERQLLALHSALWSTPIPLHIDVKWLPMLTDVLQAHMVLDQLQWGDQKEWERPFSRLEAEAHDSQTLFFHNVTRHLSLRIWAAYKVWLEVKMHSLSNVEQLNRAMASHVAKKNATFYNVIQLPSAMRETRYLQMEVDWMHGLLNIVLPHTTSDAIRESLRKRKVDDVLSVRAPSWHFKLTHRLQSLLETTKEPSVGTNATHVENTQVTQDVQVSGNYHNHSIGAQVNDAARFQDQALLELKKGTRRLIDRLYWHLDHPPNTTHPLPSMGSSSSFPSIYKNHDKNSVRDVAVVQRRHYAADTLYTRTELIKVVELVNRKGCRLSNTPDFTPKLNMSRFPNISLDPHVDCVVATAFFGTIERTIKPILHYNRTTDRCAHICFVGNKDIQKTWTADSGWMMTDVPYHLSDERMPQNGQVHPFLAAKWYKMNTPLLLPKTVRYFFWMDGDTQIINASGAGVFIEALTTRASVVTLEFRDARSAFDEMLRSEYKYGPAILQKGDLLTSFYFTHLLDGFCEEAESSDRPYPHYWRLACAIQTGWNSRCGKPRKRPPSTSFDVFGERSCFPNRVSMEARVYAQQMFEAIRGKCIAYRSGMKSEADLARTSYAPYTKIVGFDLHAEDTMTFLLYWYAITYYHWQDQVTLPVALWRFGVRPTAMPIPTDWIRQLGHGN